MNTALILDVNDGARNYFFVAVVSAIEGTLLVFLGRVDVGTDG